MSGFLAPELVAKLLGGGGPITLRLNGPDRTGHAVATRDDRRC